MAGKNARLLYVKTSREYANVLTKLEGGKSKVKNHEVLEVLKRARDLEVELMKKGNYRSPLVMVRREARMEYLAWKKKQKKK